MSRLAFDDLYKSSPSLGPSDSHASKKSQSSSERAEGVSQFDDTFKQAVKELHTNDSSGSKEKLDPNAGKAETFGDLSKKRETQNLASNTEVVNSDQKSPANVSDESASNSEDVDERTLEEAAESDDQGENEEDALIAQVMAEAAAHEEKEAELLDEVVEGETASDDTASAAGNLTDQEVLAAEPDATQQAGKSQGVEASVVTTDETLTATSTESAVSDEQAILQQSASPSEQTNIASSEIVVPQNTEAGTEATQATVSTTAVATAADAKTVETTASGSEAADGNYTAEASAAIKAAQESNAQQDSSDADQEGESEAAQNPQATAMAASAAEGEELEVKNTESKKETAATATKVENSHERPATAMGQEARPAQGSSSNPASPATEPTVDTADRVRFIERVAQAFQAQSNGNGTIRMRLSPEELGSIKIEITVRNGTMHARVETETQEARNVLMDNLPALRDRLATHNIKIEQFEIDYNAGGDQQNLSHGPEDWSDSNRNGSNNSGNDASTEETDATESITRQAASVIGSGKQLDVTA